jgi:hypothetical protein
MKSRAHYITAAVLLTMLPLTVPLGAQIQIRLGDSTRVNYSELHDALREGSPAADSVLRIMGARRTPGLWRRVGQAARGKGPFDDGLLALTRLAELRDPGSLDSVLVWRRRIIDQELPPPPATDLTDLLPGLRAIQLELDRARLGDSAVLADFLSRVPSGHYDHGDAWVAGRMGPTAAKALAEQFLGAAGRELRIRYLTLMTYSSDTTLVPLLARVFVAPDSFDLPPRAGSRASDGLLWIGTRGAVEALLGARAEARQRGTYADPRLSHADLDFLGNDSSMVVSRTGRWLTEWLAILPR